MLEWKQSQIKQFFLIRGQITPDVTVRFDLKDLIVIYFVTMFGTHWSTLIDARV